MKKTILFISVLLSFIAFLACERSERTIGGVAAPGPGAPQYTQLASVGLAPGNDYIAAVMPKGEDGPVDGGALYTKHCVACHQVTGQGIPAVFPPLDGSPYVTGDNTKRLVSIVLYGLVGPIKVLGTDYNSAMAPLGGSMNDEEVAAVVSYVRSVWSNKAGPVDAELIAAMRTKWGTRAMFSIQDLGEETS